MCKIASFEGSVVPWSLPSLLSIDFKLAFRGLLARVPFEPCVK